MLITIIFLLFLQCFQKACASFNQNVGLCDKESPYLDFLDGQNDLLIVPRSLVIADSIDSDQTA